VLALGRVPSIDATGLVALESALTRLRHTEKQVVLAGPLPEPRRVFDRANLPKHHDHVHLTANLEAALTLAGKLAEDRSAEVRSRPSHPRPESGSLRAH
jgi:SulP family sulfate permease